jgi:murein L,D-transpeptidase YcbB/YkuD
VYLVYFTAYVDENGRLNFRNDVYNHDAKQAAVLVKKSARL